MKLELERICPMCGRPFVWVTHHRNRRTAEEFAIFASTATRLCRACHYKATLAEKDAERGQRIKEKLPWLDVNDFLFEGSDPQKEWARDIVLNTLLEMPRLTEKGQDKVIGILGCMTASDVIDNRHRFGSHLLCLMKK